MQLSRWHQVTVKPTYHHHYLPLKILMTLNCNSVPIRHQVLASSSALGNSMKVTSPNATKERHHMAFTIQ